MTTTLLHRITIEYWENINLYLIFMGLFILVVFLYRREWLADTFAFKILFIISLVLFLVALAYHLFRSGNEYWGLLYLYTPMFDLLLYRYLRNLFYRKYQREPIDTALDFRKSAPAVDRLFNVIYSIVGILVPMLVILLFL